MSDVVTSTVSLQFLDTNNLLLKEITFMCDQNLIKEVNTEGATQIRIKINKTSDNSSSSSDTIDDDLSATDEEEYSD